MSSDPQSEAPRNSIRLPLAAVVFLLLTAVVSLLWSHHKLLSQDEIFVLQTDSAPSVSQLIHIQLTEPISLDPLIYHLSAHAATIVFGPTAFALRLPSLCGFLLMQVCLFFFTCRCLNDAQAGRAALFALAFPALTQTLFYSAEARPYGMLLGLYALTLLSWQAATRSSANRLPALLTLTVALGLTLNAHYFGILLLIPLCAAELFRIAQRRRIDFPVAGAIIAGMACIVFALPFQKPAGEFRKHYYNAHAISLHAITQAYRALFVDYTHASIRVQHIAVALFVLAALALIAGCAARWNTLRQTLPAAEAVFLLVLAALPFAGFLMARFVTHSIEVRYVLGALIGITVLLALTIAPWLNRATPIVLVLLLCIFGAIHIHTEQLITRELLTSLRPTPQLKAALAASSDHMLYLQDMGQFEVASYYEPDADLRSHMALVWSRENELHWDTHDTISLTADHMRHFTGFTIVPWDQFSATPGQHVMVLFHSGWDWTDQALAASNTQMTPLGPALSGDAVTVRFVP